MNVFVGIRRNPEGELVLYVKHSTEVCYFLHNVVDCGGQRETHAVGWNGFAKVRFVKGCGDQAEQL